VRTPVRILLRGHDERGDDLMLIFSVDEGAGEMTASVPVSRHGLVQFPHAMCSTGESFGPVIDAALLDRATQTVAMFGAADAWRGMRATRGRRAA
jgi:hypothetical protein